MKKTPHSPEKGLFFSLWVKSRLKEDERKVAPCRLKIIPQGEVMQHHRFFQVTEHAVESNSPLTYYYSGGAKTDDSAMTTEEKAAAVAAE